jgi:DNA helicase-2/ATP-dependent DNA helicase PcrA
VINRPRRGIGEKTLTQMMSGAFAAERSLYEELIRTVADGGLGKKARESLTAFLDQLARWRELAETRAPIEVLDAILRDTQYEESLGDPGKMETLSRLENISELRRALEEFHEANPEGSMTEYLERVTLSQAHDDQAGADDAVSLMTLHSAKGLEFPCVFITGLEESIFPSARAVTESRSIEEERRLFYVGVTRAQDRLFLSRAESRILWGRRQYNPPSTFWHEVPEDLTQPLTVAMGRWKRDPAPTHGFERARALADAAREPSTVDAPPGAFTPGTRIRHARLGEGEVLSARGHGEHRKILIRFDAGLSLEVLEAYGGLQRVEDAPF